MTWKGFFEGIQAFFEDIAFAPFNALRELAPESWVLSNIMSWIFLLMGFVAFFYWMNQLAVFNKNQEEDRSITGHSFLG